MTLFDRDPFELYRWLLTTVCAIYAIVVTTRAILHIAASFVGPARTVQVMRNYAVVLFLRMRWASFKRELLTIAAYGALLGVLLYWH